MQLTLPEGFKHHHAFSNVTVDTDIIKHISDTLYQKAKAESYPTTVRFTLTDLPLTELLLLQTWVTDLVCGDSTEVGVLEAARTQIHVKWEGAEYSGYPNTFTDAIDFVFFKL